MTDVDIYRTRDVVPATDNWVSMMAPIVQLAQEIAHTQFVPKALQGNVAGVTACILAGRELGLSPMQALQSIYVVEGRPSLSAELMRALVTSHGHHIRVVEATNTRATVEGRRLGDQGQPQRVTWTMDDAKGAGLAGKNIWRQYPRTMLVNRATSELCRQLFADVLGGISYTPEEAEDIVEVAEVAEVTPDAPTAPPARTVRRPARKALAKLPPAASVAPVEPVAVEVDDPLAEDDTVEAEEDIGYVGEKEPPPKDPELVTQAQLKAIASALGAHGFRSVDERRGLTGALAGIANLQSGSDLTKAQASVVMDTIRRAEMLPEPAAALGQLAHIGESTSSPDEVRRTLQQLEADAGVLPGEPGED